MVATEIWRRRFDRDLCILVLAYLLGITMVSLIIWGGSRFRVPIEPIVVCFAALRLASLRARGSVRSERGQE